VDLPLLLVLGRVPPHRRYAVRVVYAKQDPPDSWQHAIFLAGPTPRDPMTPSWRPKALEILDSLGYEGVVFVPEPADGEWRGSYTDQTEWEKMGLEMADKIVFWIPRDLRTMPALTTNIEYGRYVDTGKAVLGHPEGAPKMRYLDWLANDATGFTNEGGWWNDLEGTLREAIRGWDDLPVRSGGERWVPANIFTTPMFQSWYDALRRIGNRLDKAKVLWTFRLNGQVFSYVLWVDIWIASEGRHKANEWVFSRTDVVCVVLHWVPEGGALLDTKIVLVREFRSPAHTPDGFIHELPGGGAEGADNSAMERACKEVYEETGIVMDQERMLFVGSRQAVGTISTHMVHVYGYKMTDVEIEQARRIEESGEAHGEDGPDGEEQAYVEVKSIKELMREEYVDWTTLGLVFRSILNAGFESD
jgi:8-oxo-dGTP pyrophosphatase MutT (NUDIX family)